MFGENQDKTPPKKKRKSPKKTIGKLLVSSSELADFIAISNSNISSLVSTGIFSKTDTGEYDLRECVRAYIKNLRERKKGNGKTDIDTELNFWKLQNAKSRNNEWRIAYGKSLATEIITGLSNAIMTLKSKAKDNIEIANIMDDFLNEIGTVSIDRAVLAVENMDDDELGEAENNV